MRRASFAPPRPPRAALSRARLSLSRSPHAVSGEALQQLFRSWNTVAEGFLVNKEEFDEIIAPLMARAGAAGDGAKASAAAAAMFDLLIEKVPVKGDKKGAVVPRTDSLGMPVIDFTAFLIPAAMASALELDESLACVSHPRRRPPPSRALRRLTRRAPLSLAVSASSSRCAT